MTPADAQADMEAPTRETRETPARGRSRQAFETDLLQETGRLRNYALSLTRDPSDAGDLVQDCVLRALEKRHQFRQGTHMRRWLFTIMRNRHLDDCRRRTLRAHPLPVEDNGLGAAERPAPQEDWVQLLECADRLRDLRSCDRRILILTVFSQLSQKQIASRLGVAEGTVRSRLSRARAFLRDG